MKKIDLYFDFLSPFSFFAWERHRRELEQFNIEYNYKPILMGKLFSHFEFTGPGEIIVKRNYELKKCFRYAAKNNIPFSPPTMFPFNPLGIIRLATKAASAQKQSETIDLIFRAVWQNSQILEDPELIEKLFLENKLDTSIIEKSFEREAKLELKQNIKDAIALNIFGVPTMAIGEEYFWGNDSFEDLKMYLGHNDKWDRELYDSLVSK